MWFSQCETMFCHSDSDPIAQAPGLLSSRVSFLSGCSFWMKGLRGEHLRLSFGEFMNTTGVAERLASSKFLRTAPATWGVAIAEILC